MSDLERITTDRFDLASAFPERRLKSVALLSLEEALRSYYATYRTMRYSLHLFTGGTNDRPTVEFNHSHDFAAACAHALLNFQHFAELACKEERVASLGTAPSRKVLKQIYNRPFALVLDEIVASPASPAGKVIAQHEHALRKLGSLRNHLIHEGRKILLYPALDEFIGTYVLPFVQAITSQPPYADLTRFWQHPRLHCAVDPLSALVQHFSAERYDIHKVAYLKEMGRAAYESPLQDHSVAHYFNKIHQRRYEALARHTLDDEGNVRETRVCPVCGTEALLIFDERDFEDGEDGAPGRAWWYTWSAECLCCSFDVDYHLGNASEHALPIEDYWEGGDL